MKKIFRNLFAILLILFSITNISALELNQIDYEKYNIKRAYVVGKYIFDLSKHNPTLRDFMLAAQSAPVGEVSIIEIKMAENLDGELIKEYRELLDSNKLEEFPKLNVDYIYRSEINSDVEDKMIISKFVDLDIDSDLVEHLHSYLTSTDYYKHFYQSEKITKENLPPEAALGSAFFNYCNYYGVCDEESEEEKSGCFDDSKIQQIAKDLFNISNNFITKDTAVNHAYMRNFSYDKNEESVCYGKWVAAGEKGGVPPLPVIKSAEKQEDYIYIYDEYVNFAGNSEQSLIVFSDVCQFNNDRTKYTCNIYGDSDLKEVVGTKEYDATPMDPDFDTINDLVTGKSYYVHENGNTNYKYTRYKHTFKKYENSEDYYWVSSEKVK